MKQKIDREVRIKVQEELYNEFRNKCEEQYKTISIVLRELMNKYLKENV